MTVPFTARDLKQLPTKKVQEALSQLTKKQLEELNKDWDFWARPEQRIPEGDWLLWWLNCGRGFGKTRTGAETIRKWVMGGMKRIAAVAPTNNDIKKVMINGKSGFLSICSEHDTLADGTYVGFPRWSPTDMTLYWYKNQDYNNKKSIVAKVEFFSSEEPERLRGPEFEAAWCDELAAWTRDEDTWNMLQFCLRLETRANNKRPKVIVTTTPKSTKLVRKLTKASGTHLTVGSTFDNEENLAASYLAKVKEDYEGTRLGRQELYAEILTENDGALWSADMIDACQIDREDLPEMVRKVVSLDPAMSANTESDSTGLIVAGIDAEGIGYILGDYTFKGMPEAWARKAIELYHRFECDRVVYETNQGKDLIPTVLRTIDENIPLKGVHASKSKNARAEPVSALYERGKVKHVRNPEDASANLNELEMQYCTWEPMGKHKSPDRLDAAVWACTELLLKGYSQPKLQLVYSSNNK